MRNREIFCVVLFLFFICVSCATTPKQNIEEMLIEAMARECKTVEYKTEYETYIIEPAWKKSDKGCPITVIKGWRGGALFMEKEVEICECKEWRR